MYVGMNGSGIWTEPEEPEKCVTRYVVKRTYHWKTEKHSYPFH